MIGSIEKATIPNDNEAEQAVLGAIIYDNDKLIDAISLLTPSDFYSPPHQHIYRAMLELESINTPIDELLIGDQLKSLNQLDEVGGYAYLATLQECVPSSLNVKYYSEIIKNHSLLRQLISVTSDIARKSRDPEGDVTDLLTEVDSKISEIASSSKTKSYRHIKEIVKERVLKYEEMQESKDARIYKSTGFIDLDRRLTGLKPKKMMVIAGRPSMGKTALAVNIAERSDSINKHTGAIVIFSYEMSDSEVGDRAITTRAKVDYNDIVKRKEYDRDSLYDSAGSLSDMNMYIFDKMIPIEQMKNELKNIARLHEDGISLVIVDYMQLVPVLEKLPREQQISKISRTMKMIAMDFDCVVLPLSQLNRKLEERGNKRPQMSDLRESGAIEQDADIIMFVYRDEYYNPDTDDKGLAEIGIAKNRGGPVGTVYLKFDEYTTRFDNSDREYYGKK